MGGDLKSLINIWVSVVASLCFCYFVSAKLPKGKFRLLSLLPIFSIFAVLPFSLSSAFLTGVTAFLITWLGSFKLLLFGFDQGPLCSDPPKSLPVFIAIAALPIKIKRDPKDPDGENSKSEDPPAPAKKLPLNLATESVAFATITVLLYDYRGVLHPKIVLILYCCAVFLLIDVIISSTAAMVRAAVGLELEPPSDEPYLSTSLREFWARRWNLMVTNLLRLTVYRPVRSFSAAIVGPKWAPLPAVLAAFLVSGLMHELVFYYINRATPSWEMTAFFVLHGFCVVAEFGLERAVAGRWRLPWFISGPLTVGFMVATSFWLFFPPLVRNGADIRVIGEFKAFFDFIFDNFKSIFWRKNY